MTTAIIDDNSIGGMTAVLNTDGSSFVRVKINASNHALKVSNGSTGSDHGPSGRGLIDENDRFTLTAISSSDGSTIVPLYADSSGNLLIKST